MEVHISAISRHKKEMGFKIYLISYWIREALSDKSGNFKRF
jgi:hypothetical protein